MEYFASLDAGWCLVVVEAGDIKGPSSATYPIQNNNGNNDTKTVVLLSRERQEELEKYFFVKLLTPWNHFLARKNIAYLYAIANGAQFIWDFDDNMLFPNQTLSRYTDNHHHQEHHTTTVLVAELQNATECGVFNPYPFFRPSDEVGTIIWPRGYPLDKINAAECQLKHHYCTRNVSSHKIGIYQSVADQNPDVDAIYHLTRSLPVTFRGPVEDHPVLVPPHTMSPMNAQASLVSRIAMWSLFLPATTTTGRVSDIWRSYIAQTLASKCDILVTFVGPHVIISQDRNNNAHTSYLADLKAEQQLYERSGSLVSYLLHEWEYDQPNPTLEGAWERLYVDLYELGFVELQDVKLAQLWISSLQSVGYEFPSFHHQGIKETERHVLGDDNNNQCQTWKSAPKPQKTVTWWLSDLHDGTSIDVPSLLMSMNHVVLNMRHKARAGPYPDVLAGMVLPDRPLAPTIEHHQSHSSAVTEDKIKALFEYYRADPYMARTDAFLCFFPSSYCEMFMPFNRTIVFLPAHRFLLGRCSTAEAQRLVDHVLMLLQQHQQRGPRHFVGAMGVYDQQYLYYFTGHQVPVLSSSSLGYAFNRTQFFQGKRPEILVGPLQVSKVPKALIAAGGSKYTFASAKKLYSFFKLQDIADHRAVVLLPYAILSYGITELYALGIPIFVPTVDFLMELGIATDTQVSSNFYCGPQWQPPPKHINAPHPYSPESRDPAAVQYWLKFADFYTWPHIATFTSWDDLIQQLDRTDFQAVHDAMEVVNRKRLDTIQGQLEEIVDNIQLGRIVPQNYDMAIDSLWGVERLMVN